MSPETIKLIKNSQMGMLEFAKQTQEANQKLAETMLKASINDQRIEILEKEQEKNIEKLLEKVKLKSIFNK